MAGAYRDALRTSSCWPRARSSSRSKGRARTSSSSSIREATSRVCSGVRAGVIQDRREFFSRSRRRWTLPRSRGLPAPVSMTPTRSFPRTSTFRWQSRARRCSRSSSRRRGGRGAVRVPQRGPRPSASRCPAHAQERHRILFRRSEGGAARARAPGPVLELPAPPQRIEASTSRPPGTDSIAS